MDMHAAAIAPCQPLASEKDKRHPLFPEYSRYRSGCTVNLIQASSFGDWLACRDAEAVRDDAAQHPAYPEFMVWMRTAKGGARRCPAGVFPNNFWFWLGGGRW